MYRFSESVVEDGALLWLKSHPIKHGAEISPAGDNAPYAKGKRKSYLEMVVGDAARNATAQLGKLRPANHFREGNSSMLGCWCG